MKIKIDGDYQEVEPRKLTDQQKKILRIGKKKKVRNTKSLDLSSNLERIYSSIAAKYLIDGKSDQDIVNKVNRFLNKHKRVKRRFGL